MTDRYSNNRLLWIYLLLMALAGWQLLFHTQVQTDMSAFMPKALDKEQQLLLQQLEHGPAASLWMLALTNASPKILADVSGQIAQKAAGSTLVKHVMNGNMVLGKSIRERLFEYRYLLSDRITNDSFSQHGLQQMFNEFLQILRSPLSTFRRLLSDSDPGGEFLYLLQSFETNNAPAIKHGVWFNEQGNQALLLLQSSAAGTDLDAQLELRQKLLLWLDELTANGPSSQSVVLKMGGVPLISLETREDIRQTSQRLSIIATVFMLMFMFFVYRQPLKVLLAALPLLSGMLVGAACVSWWFGNIHGITLAFGITLLGVAVDYPVHLLSHQRQEENLEHTAARIWPTLALSVLSTVLGFSAMLWTDFSGLAQLGLFSMSGLLGAALVARYLLPTLSGAIPGSVRGVDKNFFIPSDGQPNAWWKRYHLSTLSPLSKLLLVIFLAFSMAWITQGKDLWSRDIQALSPVPANVRLADQEMRQAMGAPGPGHVMLVTADSIQQLLVKQEQIQALLSEAISRGYIQGADYAARILPSEQLQLQRRAWIPPKEDLITNLDVALKNLPFKSDSFMPFVDALQHSRQLPPMTPELLSGSVLGMRYNSLLQRSKHGVNGLIQLVGVLDPGALSDLLLVSSRSDLWLLDVPKATGVLMDRFRQEVTSKAVLVLIVISMLVALWLRDPVRWLKVMVPVLLSVAVSVTVVLTTGVGLNLFHLVSLLLVAGIGLDYALFFSRPQGELNDWHQTTQSLMVCCFSTVVVFLLLAVSDIPVLHAIGLTVASGALAAFGLSWLISSNAGIIHRSASIP